jgi:LuxR family maltose regulon positive regulatory protein
MNNAHERDALSPVGLLTTKLYIPSVHADLVLRPRLTSQLNDGLNRKLTLISAPAGFGKTTLLGEWIPASPRCVTRISLDHGDNEPARFWSYVIASLQMLQNNLGEKARMLITASQPPPLEFVLTTLVNEITVFPDVFALVLDDYHVIESQPIHQNLTFLLEHLPRNVHVIITSRADPPLPLSRLRARREMTELRAHDLRFTLAESAAFLNEVAKIGPRKISPRWTIAPKAGLPACNWPRSRCKAVKTSLPASSFHR